MNMPLFIIINNKIMIIIQWTSIIDSLINARNLIENIILFFMFLIIVKCNEEKKKIITASRLLDGVKSQLIGMPTMQTSSGI